MSVRYGLFMAGDDAVATYILIEAWAVLVATATLVTAIVGGALGIMFHLGGRIDQNSAELGGRIDQNSADLGGRIDRNSDRIDHNSDRIDHNSDRLDQNSADLGGRIDRVAEEVALVRERVARLEGRSGTPDPGPLQLA